MYTEYRANRDLAETATPDAFQLARADQLRVAGSLLVELADVDLMPMRKRLDGSRIID